MIRALGAMPDPSLAGALSRWEFPALVGEPDLVKAPEAGAVDSKVHDLEGNGDGVGGFGQMLFELGGELLLDGRKFGLIGGVADLVRVFADVVEVQVDRVLIRTEIRFGRPFQRDGHT